MSTENNLISTHIEQSSPLAGVTLYTMRSAVPGAVSIRGSFLGGSVFAPLNKKVISGVTAAMLDEGTKKRKKEKIHEEIERHGAEIHIGTGRFHNNFSLSGMKRDISALFGILAEELREPAFKSHSLDLVKKHWLADLAREKEDTGGEAHRLLMRELYSPEHPNHSLSVDETAGLVRKTKLSDIKQYYADHYGVGSMIIVATGDLEHSLVHEAVKQHFKNWKHIEYETPKTSQAHPKEEGEKRKFVPDKQNIDMFIGFPVGISRRHPDFKALSLGVYVLGGDSAARLYEAVRVKKGLTYIIYSRLAGHDNGTDGYFYVTGTFAPALYEKGRDEALSVVKEWWKNGITEGELQSKKKSVINVI